MAGQSKNTSIFEQFGLPQESATEYQNRKFQAQYDVQRADYNQRDYGPIGTAGGFAGNLGNIIGRSLVASKRGRLTELEQTKFKIADEARNEFDAQDVLGAYDGMEGREKALAFAGILSGAAYENNRPGMGGQIDEQAEVKRQAYAREQLENTKLQQSVDLGAQNAELTTAKVLNEREFGPGDRATARAVGVETLRKAEGDLTTYGNQTIYVDGQPQEAYVTKEGHAFSNGIRIEQDEFSRKPDPTVYGGKLINNSTRSEVHGMLTGAMMNFKGVNQITQLMAEIANDKGEINATGVAGKMVAKINSVGQNVMSVNRTLGDLFVVGKDGKETQVSGTNAVPKEVREELESTFTKVGYTGRQAERLAALSINMAYQQAMLNSKDGRVSDVDYVKAVRQTGAHLVDPETFRQVSKARLEAGLLQADAYFERDKDYGPTKAIYGMMDNEVQAFNDFMQGKSGTWGTASTPLLDHVLQQPANTITGATVRAPNAKEAQDKAGELGIPVSPVGEQENSTSTQSAIDVLDAMMKEGR